MNGFYGQFKVNIDPKGRISLPAKLRPKTTQSETERLVLTRGLDGCLALYTEDEWRGFQDRLDQLSFTKRDFRFVSRFIYSSMAVVEPDRQGRFQIPAHLLQDAELKREALVCGAYRWIEIWDPERFQNHKVQYSDSLEQMADRLFTNDGTGKE